MTALTIRSLSDANLTATLTRDVTHTHPAWVHAQLGTDSEVELQGFMDGCDMATYFLAAAALGRFDSPADAADEAGIYYAGPLYRVTSSFVDRNGVDFWNDTAEALGDCYSRFFDDEDAAQAAADDLASDLDEDSTVSYSVATVRA